MDPDECVGVDMLRDLKCLITSPNSHLARRAIVERAHLDRKIVRKLTLIGRKALK
jgi:hypothetical protein